MTTKAIGDRGETLAAEYLTDQGFTIMDANYRFERNEIDLICFDPAARKGRGEIVFVEVKTRSSLEHGMPDEAVDEEKQSSIANVARAYLYERQLEGSPSRFDVVTVLLNQGEDPRISHFAAAFTA
ncbi:MAG: YraN family protein [Bacteroidetes bacterium]|jgi:putative endonuclease|nr:YraN family protein [Bacteroidota bacterium]